MLKHKLFTDLSTEELEQLFNLMVSLDKMSEEDTPADEVRKAAEAIQALIRQPVGEATKLTEGETPAEQEEATKETEAPAKESAE